MKDENIQNIVSLYLAFHKAVPDTTRPHFQDLNRLLSPVIGGEKLERVVADFFSDQNRKILRSDASHALATSVRLIGSSRLLSRSLSKSEKALCLGVLLKLLKDNRQQHNKDLLDNISVVADIFGISKESLDSMKNIFFDEAPLIENYSSSVLLTHVRPDYNLAVEGLRFSWNEKLKAKAWFLNLPENDVILVKMQENETPEDVFPFRKNDVFPFHNYFKHFLELNGVDVTAILSELNKPAPFLPHLQILPTELTPRVVLDPDKKCISLSGHCLAVAAQHFFTPVFRWIERLEQQPPPFIEIHVNLNYFNTYSSKILLEIFFKLKRMEQSGTQSRFFWYYQQHDEELRESGEYYAEIIRATFNFVEVENSELNILAHE